MTLKLILSENCRKLKNLDFLKSVGALLPGTTNLDLKRKTEIFVGIILIYISNLILPKMLRNFMRKLYNTSDLDKKKNTFENNGLNVPELCFENSSLDKYIVDFCGSIEK